MVLGAEEIYLYPNVVPATADYNLDNVKIDMVNEEIEGKIFYCSQWAEPKMWKNRCGNGFKKVQTNLLQQNLEKNVLETVPRKMRLVLCLICQKLVAPRVKTQAKCQNYKSRALKWGIVCLSH